MITCILERSSSSAKKFKVTITDNQKQTKRTVQFGAKGYSDYTIHKDYERMQRYNIRHQKREDWTKRGLYTAGFWSKWILWNKPSLNASIRDTENKFNIKIRLLKN